MKGIKLKNTLATKEQEVSQTDSPDGPDLVSTLKIRREDKTKGQLKFDCLI